MIGRNEEKKYLLSLLNENEPQFVAVFGRRRIGKTYLIRETYNYNFTFQHTGLSNVGIKPDIQKQRQLDSFFDSLKNYGYKGNDKFNSWKEAFDALKEVIINSRDNKKIIFIDELSWMNTKSSDLISSLEGFYNGFVTSRKEKDIILIVCASATYWMMDEIVNSKGGLHNRLTGKIFLKPFTLKECEEYLLSRNIIFNRHQILQCYMIFGGVPYYWSLLKKGRSLSQNIDDLFFKENAELSDEYNNLYRALFNSPQKHIQIIEELSKVNKGLTRDELLKNLGIESSGEFSKKLKELENCGFIRKYIPYGYKTNNCFYQLIDNYTLFYHRFIKNNIYNENYFESLINTPKINSWAGIFFEKVCLEHISQIKKALGISGIYTEINAWECKEDLENGIYGSQIDLLIVRKDQIINICEMKYSTREYVVDQEYDASQRRKINDFLIKTKTKYAIHPTLVTTYGIVENSYSNNIQSIITIDDLFE